MQCLLAKWVVCGLITRLVKTFESIVALWCERWAIDFYCARGVVIAGGAKVSETPRTKRVCSEDDGVAMSTDHIRTASWRRRII